MPKNDVPRPSSYNFSVVGTVEWDAGTFCWDVGGFAGTGASTFGVPRPTKNVLVVGRLGGTLGRFVGMWDVLLGRERALLTSHDPQKKIF